MILKDHDCQGTYIDWKKLDKIRTERWEKLAYHVYKCKEHETIFDPDGYEENDFQDAEPCWTCYKECEVEIL